MKQTLGKIEKKKEWIKPNITVLSFGKTQGGIYPSYPEASQGNIS